MYVCTYVSMYVCMYVCMYVLCVCIPGLSAHLGNKSGQSISVRNAFLLIFQCQDAQSLRTANASFFQENHFN